RSWVWISVSQVIDPLVIGVAPPAGRPREWFSRGRRATDARPGRSVERPLVDLLDAVPDDLHRLSGHRQAPFTPRPSGSSAVLPRGPAAGARRCFGAVRRATRSLARNPRVPAHPGR